MTAIVNRALLYADRVAIRSGTRSITYAQLHGKARELAIFLLAKHRDLKEERIAFMVTPSIEYAVVQWGIWLAGGIAVPLCDRHPASAIEYVLSDTGCQRVIVDATSLDIVMAVSEEFEIIHYDSAQSVVSKNGELPTLDDDRRAMILYTSGTTSLPKGVVTTHKNIRFQIEDLVKAWGWKKDDRILNILPMHHVHGIINILSCALWSGACCDFLPKFKAEQVFNTLMSGEYSLFMAVPTIYYQLIRVWENSNPAAQAAFLVSCKNFRLMVSGSAALPVPVLEKWQQVSGQILLERYGMTEIGMAISNPYRGERRPGYVGLSLPSVDVRLINDGGQADNQGEIQVKGPTVFLEYWQKPEITREAFTEDGWFKTGDIAILDKDYYRILGRNSVDIIKSGGYKISALEIEEILLRHPRIRECAVVGLEDAEWGEVVGAGLVTDARDINIEDIKEWVKEFLPTYKMPRQFIVLDHLPKNTLGKVLKKDLKEYF